MAQAIPEAWLRGPLEGVHPVVMPVFFTFAQVREALGKHTEGLTREEISRNLHGAASLGFHIKHIAGSVDRLTTYLAGGQLNETQMQFMREEDKADAALDELLRLMDATLHRSEEQLKQVDPATLYEARAVGRKALPTTVIGLIVHLAEHTQRHLGQAITTIKMLRDTS
ncbi:MAG: DinB family protein [Bryobacteraceae bacterium]